MNLLTFKKEYHMLGMSLLIFLIFPWFSRQLDVTSAPIDPGILSAILLSVLALLTFKAVTWLAIKAIWPFFAGYSEVSLERNFLSLSALHQVIIYLSFYLTMLLFFVITLAALL